MTPIDTITIKPWMTQTPVANLADGYRATRGVPPSWRGLPHVNGGGVSGELPAFIEGYGKTPAAALEALERNLGTAYILSGDRGREL